LRDRIIGDAGRQRVSRGLHWFRGDLRLHDNTALHALAMRVEQWLPVFILDQRIISGVRVGERRPRFLLDCLGRLSRELEKRGVPLLFRSGRPEEVLPKLLHETGAQVLSFNEDVTPFARSRDALAESAVERSGCEVIKRLDRVVFRSSEVRTATGGAYSVYSPYRKSWRRLWQEQPRLPTGPMRLPRPIPGFAADPVPSPSRLGLEVSDCVLPTGGEAAARRRLDRFLTTAAGGYCENRDRPDLDGTSRLSPYLRHGVISVRHCVARAEQAARDEPRLARGIGKWLDELIWREFYSAIVEEHPRVLRSNHRREFDSLVWNDDAAGFEAWCNGRTGYPIVDAGMRQLRSTGWMHNRVRMIVASFLTKDLLIDWREGARFFFEQLVDGDPASNNGGWQWAASTGSDAQPYFRIFNPVTQGRRWDPEGDYVRRWIPELRNSPNRYLHEPWKSSRAGEYPPPVVDHAERRIEALARFKSAREAGARP
jgi:deoxyribodipyrimidine photo-lyase